MGAIALETNLQLSYNTELSDIHSAVPFSGINTWYKMHMCNRGIFVRIITRILEAHISMETRKNDIYV